VVVLEPRERGAGDGAGVPEGATTPVADGGEASRATAASSVPRWLRPRLLWLVPGLAVAVHAGLQSDAHGFGPLLPLAFGLGPHAGVLLGVAAAVGGSRLARAGTVLHNGLHHPLPPVALVAAGAIGLLSPLWLVGGMAWLGHVVIGWAVGDGHKSAHAHGRGSRSPGRAHPRGARAAAAQEGVS
jgi:hypothetical protein